MSETGRKRCRKTKLVPREFADIIEEDSFLQVPRPQKKSLLEKIKKEPGDHGSREESSSLQFSVKVEVEDVPDTFLDEDPSDYMKYLFSLSQESKATNSQGSSTAKKSQEDEKAFIMDPNKIHKLLPALHRRYPCDPEAVVATRNLWGKLFHELAEGVPRSLQDTELQQTLNEWKTWYLCSRNRDTPFCYKCYICSHAWWNFMDFKDHIKKHKESYIKLEIVHQECHIICYEDEQPPVREIYVPGKCLKCAMTFKEHLENKRFSEYYYYCIHCSDKFLTCGVLARHVGGCDRNPRRAMKIADDIAQGHDGDIEDACQICEAVFLSSPERENHLSICHSVRSDEPIATAYKICRQCDKPYYLFFYHVCPKRNIIHPCKYCHVKFQNKQMLELHVKMSKQAVQCKVCDKFLLKSCLQAEHYASHSDNFQVMFRCLTCKKIKLFQGDDAIKTHRMRNHRKFDNRRPGWEKILVPKLMLEQCQFNPNGGRGRKKIPVRTVRRYVPINKENNFTIAEDDELVINKTNEVAKYYKKPKETISNQVTDTAKILEQITETVDIKPDIIKVKEERNDETEPPVSNEDIDPPRLNTEELQLDPEVSKVFQATKPVEDIVLPYDPEKFIVKHEIKGEPADVDDDLIVISQLDDSDTVKEEVAETSSDMSDLNVLNLEPEIILKAGYRKRKIYRCTKCDYEGYHKEYKEHIHNNCLKGPAVSTVTVDPVEYNFKCTKCDNSFESMKTYAQHFVKHNCHYMACPQCLVGYDSITKLISHLNSHIKNQFLRIQQIKDTEPEYQTKDFQCKNCKKVVYVKDMFDHWEGHLEILGDLLKKKPPVKSPKGNTRGEYALEPEVLKRILELLENSNNPIGVPRKIKTCFVCQRSFERQNDCKRHLIEHLLEDALAKIAETGQLRCQKCKELFMKPDGYKKHMRDHGSLPIYQCSLCDKTFSDSSNFTKHKKIHNLKAFVCDLCHKKFQIKHSLEKHMEMHLTTNPYKCEPCNRIFLDRSFYNRHKRQMHERSVLRFKCFVCKEGFESLKDKWDHMWVAHKHRNNKADCPICKKGYRKYSDVRKHCQMEHSLNITLEGIIELMAQYRRVRGDNYYEDKSDIVSGQSVAVNSGSSKAVVRVESGDAVSVESGGNYSQVLGEQDSDDDVLLIEEERETLVIYDDDGPA